MPAPNQACETLVTDSKQLGDVHKRQGKNIRFSVFFHGVVLGKLPEFFFLIIVKLSAALKQGITLEFCFHKVAVHLWSALERKIAKRKQKLSTEGSQKSDAVF